jgi:hypothetical protein
MDFYYKNAIIASIIFVSLNVNNTKLGFYDHYVSITFEEEKPNVCFVNARWVLHIEYL